MKFPHHENEVAQSEAANGCRFVNYWVHNGFISIDNKKMSKSLGNFFTVREAAAAYGYDTIRMFMLMSHYRSPLNYSGEILTQAKAALDRLKTARENLVFLSENGAEGEMTNEEMAFSDNLFGYRDRFVEVMDDDFNTADALSVMFEMVREINAATASDKSPKKAMARAFLSLFDELESVLGVIYEVPGDKEDENELAAKVEAMIAARRTARDSKNYAEADRIRNELTEMGITLSDTPQGVKWSKK